MKIFIIIYNIIVFMGCTKVIDEYRVTIKAIKNPSITIKPTTYYIEPLDNNIDSNDLYFQKYANELARVLNQKGYKRAKYKNLAENIVYFDYGIETVEKKTETYYEPDISFGIGWSYPFHRRYVGGFSNWSEFGYNRYRGYSKTYNLYNRYITILAKEQNNRQLYRVDVSSVGESKDLETILPILIEASEDYIGKDTNQSINLNIKKE